MRLAFIGGGTMAEAMMRGILSRKLVSPQDVKVGEPVAERRSYLEFQHRVLTTAYNLEAVSGAELIVLAVKPQTLGKVLEELRGKLEPEQAVLSIVAGARMSTLSDGLEHRALVRVMPNAPAQIGAGISVWTCSPEVKPQHKDAVRAILTTLGEEIYVTEEKYLDMATALSASGPAYVFTFMEALIDAGVYLGLPRDMAHTLSVQTVLGSALLLKETGKHPAQLRDMVTSPGGTTVEALLVLEGGSFRATLVEAVIAAYERSLELGEEE